MGIFIQVKFSNKIIFYKRSSSLEHIALIFKLILQSQLLLTFILCMTRKGKIIVTVAEGSLPVGHRL